ncbi:hypothetical protein IBT54_003662 [Pantoea sp. S62]|nr:hypothetical protein [Pantoea sp. S62]
MMEHYFTSVLGRLDVLLQDILAELKRIIVAYKPFWEMKDFKLVHFALRPCLMLSWPHWFKRQNYIYD